MNNNQAFLAGDIHGGHTRAGVITEAGDGSLRLDDSTFVHIDSKHTQRLDVVLEQTLDVARQRFASEIHGVTANVASPIEGISTVINPANIACLQERQNLQRILEQRYSVQAAIFNDLQAEAAGVAAMGLLGNPPPQHYLYENGGTGYGGARTQYGKTDAAEPGHVVMVDSGVFVPVCGCGQEGCAEAYVGSDYVADRVRQICRARGIEITEDDPNVFADQQAKAGEEWATKHLGEMGNIWGGLWRNVLTQFPQYEKIFVTGSYLRAVLPIPAFMNGARASLRKSPLGNTFAAIPIEEAPKPNMDGQPVAPMAGAAHLLRQHMN